MGRRPKSYIATKTVIANEMATINIGELYQNEFGLLRYIRTTMQHTRNDSFRLFENARGGSTLQNESKPHRNCRSFEG
ncbi:hypothetical protein CHS0354_002631, partial [Potamilus streckersoni]